jgi:hypothetical protein
VNGYASASDLGDTPGISQAYSGQGHITGSMGGALQADYCRSCKQAVELDTDGMGMLIEFHPGTTKRHTC